LSGCVLDGNGHGISVDGTPGPYTIRGNRISNSWHHGYWHHRLKDKEESPREIVLADNDIFGNGGDGVRFDREVVDACITGNRIRRNRGQSIGLHAQMPGLWRESNREVWTPG
jgi:hypothetical protein